MRTDYTRDNSIERSRFGLQCFGAAGWLAVAGASGTWMLHGGGIVRPLLVFAVSVAVLLYSLIRGLAKAPSDASTFRELALTLRFTGYSVIVFLLGTLFLEYWPITGSMAFMFAVCRSFKKEDTSAYI